MSDSAARRARLAMALVLATPISILIIWQVDVVRRPPTSVDGIILSTVIIGGLMLMYIGGGFLVYVIFRTIQSSSLGSTA